MVNQVRTLDFLPEIFKTSTNEQFLSSTLDVLTSQPRLNKIQGFIGNKYGYAIEPTDKYVVEPTKERSDYQLDPAVTFLKTDTQTAQDFIDYPGIINALKQAGGPTENNNNLFKNQFYSWDSFTSYDMLVNYAQYYWLPMGPDAILIYDTINTADIIGQKNYTTPGGVEFINGLKVNFSGPTTPLAASNVNYYVEGVGTAITLVPQIELPCTEVTGGGVYTPWDTDTWSVTNYSIMLYLPVQPDYIVIDRASRDRNAWSRGNRWFHQSVIDATIKYNGVVTTNPYNTQSRAQRPIIQFQSNLSLYNSGNDFASIVDFIDTATTDAFSQVVGQTSFTLQTQVNRTSNRSAPDGIVVNNTDNLYRGMAVTFSGTVPAYINTAHTYYVNVIDVSNSMITICNTLDVDGKPINPVTTTTAAYNMNLTAIAEVGLLNNATVVFANDNDEKVRQTVYTASFVSAGAGGDSVIALTPIPGVKVNEGSQIYVATGPGDYVGTAWRFTVDTRGSIRPVGELGWVESQLKTSVNQAPLFDIYDTNGISLGDKDFYAQSTFTGCKLFAYEIGTGTSDAVLGFPVVYSSPANVGDFLFTVNLNSDQFTYANSSTGAIITSLVSIGYVHYHPTLVTTVKRIGWVQAAAPSVQYQVFTVNVDELTQPGIVCDVIISAEADTIWSPAQVYKNGSFLDATEYTTTVDTTASTTTFTFTTALVVGDQVSILLISDQVSKTAYYQVPSNLQSNPFNEQIATVASGDIKNYYASIFGNAPGAQGQLYGNNNINNLGDVTKYGTTIAQNSASLLLPGVFLRKAEYNLSRALQYNSDEYADYKAAIVDLAVTGEYSRYQTPAAILDDIIYKITSAKNQSEPFYWSDMLVSGSPYKVNTYNFKATVTTSVFPLTRIYNFSSANYYGLAIYLTQTTNGISTTSQLIRGVDYTVSETEPSVVVNMTLSTGQTITIKEYNQTFGSYIPNTPTKLGLYAKTIPHVTLDNTYTQPTYFIVGHDGSYNKLYGDYTDGVLNDFRDLVLLEFETRIYNNIKVSGPIPLEYTDVFPGQWRTTDYTWDQIMPVYKTSFLNWIGKNRMSDYRRQVYTASNEFTYNYNKTTNKLTGKVLQQGYWRGIYNWFYDTTNPANAPWEMLGFTSEPTWWTQRYGAAPYTSGNTLMWQEIADGYVWNNGVAYIEQGRKRPQLLQALPVDIAGNLVDPMINIVGIFDKNTFERSWVAGDQGPTESSYLKSSQWPFDMMRIMSTLSPAKFYNLMVDRDLYKYDAELGQYLFNDRYHLEPSELTIYGSGTSKNSYINWIVDYVNQHGTDGQAAVTTTLNNLDVRLVYRVAGFSDKQYLTFLTENSSPSSTSNNLLIPDDSYSIMLYDNVPSDKIVYSSVIIQRTEQGYTVWGNSVNNPYFTTVAPKIGAIEKIRVGKVQVELSLNYDPLSSVPIAYGTEFYSLTGVSEFLRNYGRWLTERGVVFENVKSGVVVDWTFMVDQFLRWAQQSWEIGSTVSLNPNATAFSVYRPGLVVQPLTIAQQNFVLNQNLIPLKNENMAVIRQNEEFRVKILSDGDSVAFTNLNLSALEHAVVFDNTTIFGDTIYNTASGLRQTRLVMYGKKSAEWNGYINAQGFILNEGDVQEWSTNGKYPKGQIVKYKNLYWSAIQLVEPSAEFDYAKWTQSNYDSIKQGMLPNPSTTAYESSLLYDIHEANLGQDEDLLAFGLIGFRPRTYMADASLTDISQVNIYNNMIKAKGTNLAANAFKSATPLQGELDYDVRENWALKTATFGSVLNSNFVEVQLQQGSMTSNPSLIGFGDADTSFTGASIVAMPTGVQQQVAIGNIALRSNTSYTYKNELINFERSPTNANFLPPYSLTYVEERGLPTAGYVNINDTKFQAYILADLNLTEDSYKKLYRGDIVWIANYRGGWDVVTPVTLNCVLFEVKNNLNGTITMMFTAPHGLVKDQPFVINSFDSQIDGYYTVVAVTGLNTIRVKSTLSKSTLQLSGTGIAFKLQTRRVAQPSDMAEISYHVPYSEFATSLNWTDEDADGVWTVYASSPIYQKTTSTTNNNDYGVSVAYTSTIGTLAADGAGKLYRDGTELTGLSAGIGATTQLIAFDETVNGIKVSKVYCSSPSTGQVYVYTFNGTNISLTQTITTVTTGAIAVSQAGGALWLYVAVSGGVEVYYNVSGTYTLLDTLTNSATSFGASIATAVDGSKVIVGAPLEDITIDTVSYTDAGRAYVYSRASENFLYNSGNNGIIIPPVFTVSSVIPASTAAVYVNTVLQATSAYIIVGNTVTFTTAPPDGTTIQIDYAKLTLQQTTSSAIPHIGADYGRSVTTSKSGAEIFIGAPYELATVNDTKNVEGAVYRWTNSGQRYGKVTFTPPSYPVTVTVFFDGFKVNIAAANAAEVVTQINAQEPTNIVASASAGVITVVNAIDGTPYDQVDVVGLTAADLTNLGITPYTNTQVINDLTLDSNSQFGWSVLMNQELNSTRNSIVISAPSVNTISETTFDFIDDIDASNDTIFDNGATTFVDTFEFTGGVFEYDYLPSQDEDITNPGKYAFGQYVNITVSLAERQVIAPAARYGSALAFNDGHIVVGSPNWYANGNGRVVNFTVPASGKPESSWYIDKQPIQQVDVNRLNTISIYDTETNQTLESLDYIDPVQGKLLSAVETNIDFIGAVDPATYSGGMVWEANHVGKTWLDTTNLRMMNYNQPDVVYNASYWGEAFPGSTADIFTWVVSTVTPLNYAGSGFVVNFNNYTESTILDRSTNTLQPRYYFWVKNFTEVPAGKTLSPTTVAQYILNPVASGVAFLAAITTNVVGLYNVQDSVQSHSSALHLGYSQGVNGDSGHQAWTLFQDGNEEHFLAGVPSTITGTPTSMYLKYLNSFMAMEINGLVVPDPELPKLARYGTSFRPRQSMFVDRPLALENYITYANTIMSKYTITELRGLFLLNQSNYITSSVTESSNTKLLIATESGGLVSGLYINQPVVFQGTMYGGLLSNKTYYITEFGTTVISNVSYQYMSISDTLGGTTINLADVYGSMSTKLWDTTDYWSTVDWWATGYSADTKVTIEVQTYTDLLTIGQADILNASTGSIITGLTQGLVARVVKNGQGLNEYYVWTNAAGWTRIGLQAGTILIDSTLHTQLTPVPSMEIYYIVRWITEQLYTNELSVENNSSLIMMFEIIQSQALQQQNYLPWLNKTSLVDVSHTIRQLYAYKKYQRDIHELVNGYLNEVKPYHVYIKDFSFKYNGIDTYNGVFTDFDLPSQYNNQTQSFISPQLVYSDVDIQTGQYLPNSSVWTQTTNSDWFNNYGLTISNSEVKAILVTSLTVDLSSSASMMVVNDSSTLPARGTLLIGVEQITYTQLDRANNVLTAILRGTNNNRPLDYPAGTPVYLVPEPVIVMNTGRGYTSAPAITLYFDTATYPYGPRTVAEFTPTLSNERLVSVALTNPGSGYPVMPQVRVGISSIKAGFLGEQIDTITNEMYVPGHDFITGDCVTITGILDDTQTVINNYDYFYVYVIDENRIALYYNYKDAVNGFSTTETTYTYSIVGDTIRLITSFSIDAQPYITGDLVSIINPSMPATTIYYYVEQLDIYSTNLVSSNFNGNPTYALYATLEEAKEGNPLNRITLTAAGTLTAASRSDDNRVNLSGLVSSANNTVVSATVAVTARVEIYVNDQPVREMKVGMKFDRTTYRTTAINWNDQVTTFSTLGWSSGPWSAGRFYKTGDLAVYNGILYRCILDTNLATSTVTYVDNTNPTSPAYSQSYSAAYASQTVTTSTGLTLSIASVDASVITFTTPTSLDVGTKLTFYATTDADSFTLSHWIEVPAEDPSLNAADRIAGFYRPTGDMPGFLLDDMSQLMTGVKNPNQTILDPVFTYGTTYAFLGNQVDTIADTINLHGTQELVASYEEVILSSGSAARYLELDTTPVATRTYASNSNMLLNSFDNISDGQLVEFSGSTFGGLVSLNTTYSIVNSNSESMTVQITTADSNLANIIAFANSTGYSTVLLNSVGDYVIKNETTFVTGDLVKVQYTAPVARVTDYYYVHKDVSINNRISLHSTAADAITGANKIAIPGGALGQVVKPQTVISLSDAINAPVGTVQPMLFDQSTHPINFGLKKGITYWTAVVSSGNIAVFNNKNDAENNVNRIPLLNKQGGQLITGTYDTIVQAPEPTNTTNDYNVVGAPFTFGYAPEELMAGIITDGINFTVTTKPGSTWNPMTQVQGIAPTTNYAHSGFNMVRMKDIAPTAASVSLANGTTYTNPYIVFSDIVANPVTVTVYSNATLGQTRLTPGTDYNVDWVNQAITFVIPVTGSTLFDIVVYEFGNGSQLVRSNSTQYPLRSVLNTDKLTYHSEIYLDVPYSELEMPSATNFWLSAMVFAGSTTEDTAVLTYLSNSTDPNYGPTDPTAIGYLPHYTIQPQRQLDPVNDPYNPAKIVFTNEYDPKTSYVTFALSSNVIGMYVVGHVFDKTTFTYSATDIEYSYEAPIVDPDYTVTKLAVYVNGQPASTLNYSVTNPTVADISVSQAKVIITFNAGSIKLNDNIKITYNSNGVSIPTTQWFSATDAFNSGFDVDGAYYDFKLTNYLGDENYTSFSDVQIASTGGTFICASSIKLKVGDRVTVTGTSTGTGSIVGTLTKPYTSPKTYYINSTDGYTQFTLTSFLGGPPDIITVVGTTTGLTFSTENNMVIEIDGLRYDGSTPTQVFRKITVVGDAMRTSYPAPVYGITNFDINFFNVQINGATIPQVNPGDSSQVYWNINYDFTTNKFYQVDADFVNTVFGAPVNLATDVLGFFDDGTPFDNQFSFSVVFNPAYQPLNNNDVVTISYEVPPNIAVPPDIYTVTANANQIGGTLRVRFPFVASDKIAVTTFARTTDQSLLTQRVTDATVTPIPAFNSTLINVNTGTPFKGVTLDGINPPLITLDSPHNLIASKNPLQQVYINGSAITDLDGQRFWVSWTNYVDSSTVQDTSRQVYLYNDPNPTSTTGFYKIFNASPVSPFGSSFIQLLDGIYDITVAMNPTVIEQPVGYTVSNVDRLFVNVIDQNNDSLRQYIGPEKLKLVNFNGVSTLLIAKQITPGDKVLITSMVPTASPDETTFRINNTWNIVSGIPNIPEVYRENQFTRTYVSSVNEIAGVLDSFTVADPYTLVTQASFVNRPVALDELGQLYTTIGGTESILVTSVVITKGGTSITDFTYTGITNLTTVKIIFGASSGVVVGDLVKVVAASGNAVLINGEEIRFGSIDLEYTSPTYGLISQLYRSSNFTGSRTVNKYDSVQGILSENVLEQGYYNENWYSNDFTTTLTSTTAGSTNVYNFPYVITEDSNTGVVTYPQIDEVVEGDLISFGNIDLDMTILSNNTGGILTFAVGNNTSTTKYITGVIPGTQVTIVDENGDPVDYVNPTSGAIVSTFSVANTHGNFANSQQWMVELNVPVAVNPNFTATFADSNPGEYKVDNSYISLTANTWSLEISGNPTVTAATTAYIGLKTLDLPLQFSDNSGAADFLNQQIR